MLRRYEKFASPALGRDMEVLIFGHYGPPLLVIPSAGGRFYDWENQGMIEAAAPWIEAGKARLICADSIDHEAWLNHAAPLAERSARHHAYQHYLAEELTPLVQRDCGIGQAALAVTGCSLGGLHAAALALHWPHLFNYALCMSGRYDLQAVIAAALPPELAGNDPLSYCRTLTGNVLEAVRQGTHLTLVCGQGAWEEKCLAETRHLTALLAAKQISHDCDLWGYDVEHHWYWWKRQLAYYLGKTLSAD